jgi:predicted transcriptional regulator
MENIPELYKKAIATSNNSKEVLRLLRQLKYETIMWFDRKGYSGRQIANMLGLSNTRVSQIIKTVKIL